MFYLPTIDEAHARWKLRRIYKAIKKGLRVKRVPAIFEAFSTKPPLLGYAVRLASQITFGGSSLGRRWEEMLATAVSSWNRCHY